MKRSRLGTRALAALGLALLAVGSLSVWGCGRGGDEAPATPMQTVGDLKLGVSSQPDPSRTGDNRMVVVVRDAEGKPVRGAALEVVVSMAAMGTMPRMESRGRVRETRPGVYEARYGLAMNGEWDVAIGVRPRLGAAAEAAYRLSTSSAGLTFVGGTPAAAGAATMPGMPGMAAGGPAATPAADGAPEGTVVLDAARRQSLGVRTAPVERRPLSATIRSAGRVAYDETRQSEVSLKLSGWVRELKVDYTGQPVRAGEVLFTAYSPELWSGQQEYLEARRAAREDSARGETRGPSFELADAARRRLLLWDLTPAQINELARAGKPREAVPILAPTSGIVTEKNIVRGSAFTAGQVLYRIVRLDVVWVIASVYQMDLPLVTVGSPATLLNPFLDERSRSGRVSFVSPTLDTDTRTGQVRIEVANPRGLLKPGTFVDVEMNVALGSSLAVPESAVLPTGERRIVFVDLGDGRLSPREVRLGHRAQGYYEVLEGLTAGEIVVTSGNFMIAAESKLKSAAQKW